MENFKIIAISFDGNYGTSYVFEGDEMYYYINEHPENGGFDTVYPCPVGQVAGRFRHNWLMKSNQDIPIPEQLAKRIEAQKEKPDFLRFCNEQKLKFGRKRFEL